MFSDTVDSLPVSGTAGGSWGTSAPALPSGTLDWLVSDAPTTSTASSKRNVGSTTMTMVPSWLAPPGTSGTSWPSPVLKWLRPADCSTVSASNRSRSGPAFSKLARMARTGVAAPPYSGRPVRRVALFTVTLNPAYQRAFTTGTVCSRTAAAVVVVLSATATVVVAAACALGSFDAWP